MESGSPFAYAGAATLVGSLATAVVLRGRGGLSSMHRMSSAVRQVVREEGSSVEAPKKCQSALPRHVKEVDKKYIIRETADAGSRLSPK